MLDEVRAILSDPGVLGEAAWNIDGAAELQSLGLNSMQLVQILVDIEELFGVEIPDELLAAGTFRTIESIVAAVKSAQSS
ncbi:phosphopantetheine-binding protein [Streptomyces sp. NBC_01518]|uniref:phosphopantetheine-binding protein n=1 Tax=Streptomyces sp. NBC_01518 TaxID=2903891 RepID=UPI003868FB0A